MTATAELFGTEIRATATTSVTNLVRSMVIPFTLALAGLRVRIGVINASIIIGMVVFTAAFVALFRLRETFAADLAFLESNGQSKEEPVATYASPRLRT